MITKLRKRIESEKGFTLIEMLIVIIILGILIAIAVPAYLSFRDKANQRAAESNIRAAIPAIEDYHATNAGYQNMDVAALKLIDPAIKGPPLFNVKPGSTATTYCVEAQSGTKKAYKTQATDIIPNALCP